MDNYASYFNTEDARSHFSESLQHSPFPPVPTLKTGSMSTSNTSLRSEVFSAVLLEIQLFWDVMLCILVNSTTMLQNVGNYLPTNMM
jgi:hypothetical protein